MCNDGYPQYQADYYHVLASSFLSCRRAIAEKDDAGHPISAAAISYGAGEAHLELVRVYKLKRFKETLEKFSPRSYLDSHDKKITVDENGKAMTNEAVMRLENEQALLNFALKRLGAHSKPALPSYEFMTTIGPGASGVSWGLDPETYKKAEAIAARYEFEVNFRVEQHRMGQEFGKANCANYKPGPATVAEGTGVKEIVHTSGTGKADPAPTKVPAR